MIASGTGDMHGLRRLARGCAVLIGVSVLALTAASPAFAGAWWRLSSRVAPTFLAHGGNATIVVAASNVGDAGVNATNTPITIKDTLPPGLEATEIRGEPAFHKEVSHLMTCELATLTCRSKPETYPAFEQLDVIITARVRPEAAAGAESNQASVHGGEQEDQPGVPLAEAAASERLTIDDQPTPFGVEAGGYALDPEAMGGFPDSQAGSHPFQLTTKLDLNQILEENPKSGPTQAAPAQPRNLSFNLPPGLVGDPQGVPRCPTVAFLAINETDTNSCEPESAIGVVEVTVNEPNHFGDITRAVPLFNLEPARGEPARFGFEVLKVPVVLDVSVRTDGDYGVTVGVTNASQAVQILGSEVTIWGSPGDPSHDQSRGWACLLGGVYFNNEVPCDPPTRRSKTAFLTLPGSCTGQISTDVEGASWPLKLLGSEPGRVLMLGGNSATYRLPAGLEGCDALPFIPTMSVAGEGHEASTPTGLAVDVHLPQQSTLEPTALAESDLRATTVTLPEGVELNPSSANGLQACSEQQIGYEGAPGPDPLSEGAAQPLRFSLAPATCPDASKVGTVRVRTPLIEHELEGSVYVATPAPSGEIGKNPFDSLLALYVVAEDPYSGIRAKLAGEVRLNGQTGQITSTFLDTPQVPFEDFRLNFFGGPRGAVSTPPLCGTYTSEALFTPWSGSETLKTSTVPEEFDVTSGPNGAPCANPQPFAPTFEAGSTNLQAGAFSPFVLTIGHPDADQPLQSLALRLPAGVAAMISSVTPCLEPPAGQEWSCGPESLIGHSTAWSGLGPDAVALAGSVYLTTGYGGAPFGLVVVTSAVAGPFDLGNVAVRSRINVDPSTAAVTITSDPFPSFVRGVPAQIKQLDVTVDRPGFEFNPTSCDPTAITGTITGASGGIENASSPFQVGGCEELPFAPKLTASVDGQASRQNGATFRVKLESAGLGQANIRKVNLQLPLELPSRLTTLQKACLAQTFEANPAGCSEESIIGTATIHTPVLRNPLTGPAYLVSHGGAAFPDVEFVLQGEGITLLLDGKTDIKNGITYSKFETAPDAPFSTFETVLPAGPHSALTAFVNNGQSYDLCSSKLEMPTTITAQNNHVIEQQTPVTPTGCGAVKGTTVKKLTLAQQLAKALKACRSKYKYDAGKRASCERKAHRVYTARAIAACRKAHNAKKQRAGCEAQARRKYAAHPPRRPHAH